MMVIGFVGFALGTWQMHRDHQGLGFLGAAAAADPARRSLMLCMVPINNIALGTLPPARMKNASGLFNLTRNLGGAVGLALINTVLNDRMDLHLARLHETCHLGQRAPRSRRSTCSRRGLASTAATRRRWR